MRPVHQTVFGNEHGNCLAACFASILEVHLDDLPSFLGEDWQQQWGSYLKRHFGLYLWRVDVPEDGLDDGMIPPGWSILTGESPRAADGGKDWLHCTVAFNGETVHDPHPDGRGVLTKTYYLFFQALQPERLRGRPE